MIKKCKIISYNKFLNILVFEYDKKRIQTNHILENDEKFVYVKRKGTEFEITNEDDYKKNLVEKNKNNSIKNPKKEDELIDEITSE